MFTTLTSVSQEPYEITLDLTFSDALWVDAELTNSANYTLSNSAYVRKVDILADNQLRLWVEKFYGHLTFVLNIVNVRDIYGDLIIGVPVTISPFYSTANISNYNGLIRTSHDDRFVTMDTQRIYLAGAQGIDVFRRERVLGKKTWGQVFDGYGINAFFVANYPSDLVITDTHSPYISYANPASGGTTTNVNTHIIFVIYDVTTATEITTTLIYVNGIVAFNGSSGWQNNFCGSITVAYQRLVFNIWHRVPFALGAVTVRVIASDLLSNAMDQSYSFTIIP
jgi:hypothetical protein